MVHSLQIQNSMHLLSVMGSNIPQLGYIFLKQTAFQRVKTLLKKGADPYLSSSELLKYTTRGI